jgi:hypothetical protein
MKRLPLLPLLVSLLLLASANAQSANLAAHSGDRLVVFWQPGFPTISSTPIDRSTLTSALGSNASFADIASINDPATLSEASLLVLPYGSAVPVDAWNSITHFLDLGGNLLILGGQPLHVPVSLKDGHYLAGRPQDSYALALGLRHTYEIPVPSTATFAWKRGYAEGITPKLQAKHFFVVEGRLDGLGYMTSTDGELVAAPIVFGTHFTPGTHSGTHPGAWGKPAGRFVALDFDPLNGFWSTPDATTLLRRAAEYARQGTELFSVEAQFAALRPGESPTLTVHLKQSSGTPAGEVKVDLSSRGQSLESVTLPVDSTTETIPVNFKHPLPAGFYEVNATWRDQDHLREFYRNGFWVEPAEALLTGPTLAANSDTLTLDTKPFLPVGTNYFTTEENGWDFSSPRNAAIWEHDFAEMQSHGVSFVRTGVWMSNARFVDPTTGGVNDRFLRNLEGFLLSAQHHNIAVNFTFFAFSPKSGTQPSEHPTPDDPTPPNPYLDTSALRAQQAYIRSIIARFGKVPFLSWDLINEPSVSNPRHIFSGNYPNGDPSELAAWRTWLRQHYPDIPTLADAWSVTPTQLGSFDTIPLPEIADLRYARNASTNQVRAIDYNLFAQDLFRSWVVTMVTTIRDAGSTQLIDVGQDEGGVTDRVLNRFYAGAGVGFTTNHTYWQDDALLWDSVAAKVPGTPNITGETGYQPSWAPDGTWRYDEITGLGLTERKWALGFAAGSTGAMQWDWAREVDFGMQRSDGSAKLWENMMRDLGTFATAAAPHARSLKLPPIAIVLPESLQLSVFNPTALEAQQAAVRTLYAEAHGSAYAVGEYQIDQLGTPRLILLPSPYALTDTAWSALLVHVRDGATLLITGPFDADAHLHPTPRATQLGLPYATEPLQLREQSLHWPGGSDRFTFGGNKTTALNVATLADGSQWKDLPLGKGRILFSTLPLELGENQAALGRVYAYAMQRSGVAPLRVLGPRNPGILIAPTVYADATLFVVTSETTASTVSFIDPRSHATLTTDLAAGRAALVMVGTNGKILASYHWGLKPLPRPSTHSPTQPRP